MLICGKCSEKLALVYETESGDAMHACSNCGEVYRWWADRQPRGEAELAERVERAPVLVQQVKLGIDG